MKKFRIIVLAIMPLFTGIGPGAAGATDSAVPAGTPPSGAMFLATPMSDNHYLLHAEKTRPSASHGSTAAPENAAGSHFGMDNISQTPDNSNNAGEPNMGSGDHVQGTTGTSGQ